MDPGSQKAVSGSQILAVIRFSALGDVALIVPVLLALYEQYPDCRVVLCTRPRFAPLFDTMSNVTVLPAHLETRHQGIQGLLSYNRALKNKNPDIILDLHYVLRTRILRTLNWFNHTPFLALDKGKNKKRKLTRAKNKEWHKLPHTTDRYAAVFREAGYALTLKHSHILARREIGEALLKKLLDDHILVGIAPFAAHSSKIYDLGLLEEVVAWLDKQENCKILCFGYGEKEQKQVEPWEERYPNCINLIGRYDFSEELNVISQLDLMISMDSGNGHLSAIFGVPTITIWGVTHPYLGFAPFAQPEANSLLADRDQYPLIPTSVYGNRSPEGYEKAINTVSVSAIKDRIEAILGW